MEFESWRLDTEKVLVSQRDYILIKGILSELAGPTNKQDKSWVTKQDKPKRKSSNKENYERGKALVSRMWVVFI